jgi:glutamyl-tRNA synthetase
MILGEDKKRLSKRHGATGVDQYRDLGYQPGALLNYLALLGWNPGTEEEIFELDKLVEQFELSKVQKKSAVFDHKKFNWVSSQHLMAQSNADILHDMIKIDPQWEGAKDRGRAERVIDIMKPRSCSLVDLIDRSSYFFAKPAEFNERDLSKVWKADTPEIMKELQMIFESISDWIPNEIESKFKEFMDSNGLGFGKVMRPLRFALCGNVNGPSLFEIMEIIGKDDSLNRINHAIKEF